MSHLILRGTYVFQRSFLSFRQYSFFRTCRYRRSGKFFIYKKDKKYNGPVLVDITWFCLLNYFFYNYWKCRFYF